MQHLQNPKAKIAIAVGTTVLSLIGAKKYFAGGVNRHTPDLSGQVVIVTGGTDGIGLEAAREFAKLGAKVIITGRSENKAEAFIKSLPETYKVSFMKCDFADLQNVKKFAEKILEQEEKIDILVNNAGLNSPEFKKSAQDLEFTIAVNHFAPVYLTSLLLPLLQKAEKARVINVASLAHRRATLDFDEIFQRDCPTGYNWLTTYGNTKMANVIFTRKLAKELIRKEIENVKTASLHPGAVLSGFSAPIEKSYTLAKVAAKVLYPLLMIVFKNNREGAQTTLHCSLMPWEKLESGEYYADCKVTKTTELGYNEEKIDECWTRTNQIIKNRMSLGEDIF